ncbi:hypothetical protein KW800_00585 [Candidatus Parcubacteria bacterium]|nr:hypothetical protein [Candidatus Parcubacteria bacterium]
MKRYSYLAFGLLLVAYILFQARYLLLGPRISVDTPEDNSTAANATLTVSGTARNTSLLTLDDRPIYTDKAGHWQDKLILSPGLNIIKLDAKDRFGRQTEKLLRVVLN